MIVNNAMNTTVDNNKVNELLAMQTNELHKLCDLLDNELAILKQRDLAQLEQNSQSKEQLLNNINQLDQALSIQISPQELKANTLFQEQVQTINQLLQACKNKNEVNGQIINNSQVAINRFKGMLQQSIANNSMTYDNKGQTNINTNSIGVKA